MPVEGLEKRGQSVVRRVDMNFWLSSEVETSVGRRETGRVSLTGVQGNPPAHSSLLLTSQG